MNTRPHQHPERIVELDVIERNVGPVRRHRRHRALVGAVLAATASLGSVTVAAGGLWTDEAPPATVVPRDRVARFDPGPAWSPDYGLLCEILERYGRADVAVCSAEPVTSTSGPV